jgi:hypothetical protein
MFPGGPLAPLALCLAIKHLARGPVPRTPHVRSETNLSISSAAGNGSHVSLIRVVV